MHRAEPMARQTIKKPISRQGGPQVRRPIFGLNCEILRTGGWVEVGELLCWCSSQFTRAGWSPVVHCIRGQGPDTTLVLLLRYNLKAPHQHRTSGHQAKECLPSCCHQQLPKVVTASSCQAVKVVPGSPFRTSLVAHLSSCCQSQDLALVIAAETFEKK